MWKPDICIYHGGCDDGFGAAWAIWKRWGDDVAFVSGIYGKPLPECEGKNVIFVDFSAKRDAIEEMAAWAKSIVIIDHHKTAEAELEPFKVTRGTGWFSPDDIGGALLALSGLDRPPVVAWFDMEQSGAVMAWKFAHGDRPVPEFLRYIEDRDLWRFRYGIGDATKQFSASLKTYEQEFNLWDKLAEPSSTAHLIAEGAGILRAHKVNIEKMLADSYMDLIGGLVVPVANIPGMFASDVGNALLKKYPDAPFAATWSRGNDEKIKISLRSEDSRIDVSKIAATFGGGGHRNAAGYSIPIFQFLRSN